MQWIPRGSFAASRLNKPQHRHRINRMTSAPATTSRLARGLFTGLSVISLLVCLAVGALWVRSHWSCFVLSYEFTRPAGEHVTDWCYRAFDTPGRLGFARSTCTHADFSPEELKLPNARAIWSFEPFPASDIRGDSFGPNFFNGCTNWWFHGFGLYTVLSSGGNMKVVVIPYGLLFVLFAILPSFRAQRFRRQYRRKRMGLCLRCGYDLRASTIRCPECGAPIPAQVRTPT